MISFPPYLGEKIRSDIDQYRKEMKIAEPEELKKVYNKNQTFLEEELQYVTTLYILDPDSLKYKNLFPNIKRVVIDCDYQFSEEEIQNIIDMYPNIVELKIHNQKKLNNLDLSKHQKIEILDIVENIGLKKITGLEKLNNLFSLTFYNNSTYFQHEVEKLCLQVQKLAMTKGTTCNIDVLYIPEMLKTLKNVNIPLEQFMLYHNVKWYESLKCDEYLEYSTQQLYMVYKKAKQIVDKYIRPTDTELQKYAILNEWMCQNIIYDKESLNNDNTHRSNGQNAGVKMGANGTLNALLFGYCVCQGYTKTMQLFLKLCNIHSIDVHCKAGRTDDRLGITINGSKRIEYTDHSIIRVYLDSVNYYSDVTVDAVNTQTNKRRKYFLLSKKDIENTHTIFGEETVIAERSISEEEQESLIRFAQNRIAEVDQLDEDNEKKNARFHM